MGEVGSRRWIRAQHGATPLYFDRNAKKGGLSGVRYERYKFATTLGEYLVLNDQEKWSADFQNDYSKKLLRLFPSAALLSVSHGERASVNHLTVTPPPEVLDGPATTVSFARTVICRCCTVFVVALTFCAQPSRTLLGTSNVILTDRDVSRERERRGGT